MAVTWRRIEHYDRAAIRAAVADALAGWGGLDGVLGDAHRIVLKPNFVLPEPPDAGACTHPDFYLAIAEMVQDSGRQVTIGESPAFGSCETALRRHGVLDECRERGIDTLTFGDPQPMDGPADTPRYRRLSITGDLKRFDAMINLPKLKVHQQFYFSGATKNLYGCVTGKRKTWRHFVSGNNVEDFARMILATARAAAPAINIADGILAMHRRGPRGGDMYPLHTIIVGDDVLEVDWLFCRRSGLDVDASPLFRVLGEDERVALEEAMNGLEVRGVDGFEASVATDIRFNSGHLVRSVYRSWHLRK